MKKHYETPLLEVIELSTEQRILEVSNGILTLLATAPYSDGIETMSGWGDARETWTD